MICHKKMVDIKRINVSKKEKNIPSKTNKNKYNIIYKIMWKYNFNLKIPSKYIKAFQYFFSILHIETQEPILLEDTPVNFVSQLTSGLHYTLCKLMRYC